MGRTAQVFLTDTAVGLLAGLVATQVTNLAQRPLARMTPERVKRQERRVSPGGTSSGVAAEKVAEGLDLSLGEREMKLLGKAIHFGTGMAWGPVYGLLRRHAGLRPIGVRCSMRCPLSLTSGPLPSCPRPPASSTTVGPSCGSSSRT